MRGTLGRLRTWVGRRHAEVLEIVSRLRMCVGRRRRRGHRTLNYHLLNCIYVIYEIGTHICVKMYVPCTFHICKIYVLSLIHI